MNNNQYTALIWNPCNPAHLRKLTHIHKHDAKAVLCHLELETSRWTMLPTRKMSHFIGKRTSSRRGDTLFSHSNISYEDYIVLIKTHTPRARLRICTVMVWVSKWSHKFTCWQIGNTAVCTSFGRRLNHERSITNWLSYGPHNLMGYYKVAEFMVWDLDRGSRPLRMCSRRKDAVFCTVAHVVFLLPVCHGVSTSHSTFSIMTFCLTKGSETGPSEPGPKPLKARAINSFPYTMLVSSFSLFWDKVSCSLGWPSAWYVARD